jgi:hypothetical protein
MAPNGEARRGRGLTAAFAMFHTSVTLKGIITMREHLIRSAKEYVALIEKIERTRDPQKLQALEEKRVDCHWLFIELLKKNGIKFKDRDHATRIAFQIANGES